MNDIFITDIYIINNVIKANNINKDNFYTYIFNHEMISDDDVPYTSYKYEVMRLQDVIDMLKEKIITFLHGVNISLTVLSEESYKDFMEWVCFLGSDIDIQVKKRKIINRRRKRLIKLYLTKKICQSESEKSYEGIKDEIHLPLMEWFCDKYKEAYTIDITFNLYHKSKIDKPSPFKYKQAVENLILLNNKIQEMNEKNRLNNPLSELKKESLLKSSDYQSLLDYVFSCNEKKKNKNIIFKGSLLNTNKLLIFLNNADFKYYCNKKINTKNRNDLILLRNIYLSEYEFYYELFVLKFPSKPHNELYHKCNKFNEYQNMIKNLEMLQSDENLKPYIQSYINSQY